MTEYHKAALRILTFWKESEMQPASWDAVDVATSAWLEHIIAEGGNGGL